MKSFKDIISEREFLKVDPAARGQRQQRKSKLVVEVSMNNEGQAFYTDNIGISRVGKVDKIDVGPVVKKMKKAVDALNKNVPGGTWTVTVDGKVA